MLFTEINKNNSKGVKHRLPYYIEKERKVIVIPAIYKNNVKYSGGVNSGESTINSISINGTTISPDENKNVDIIIPDNTELSNRVTSNEEAISTLNGSGEGSVSKTVDDALNEFAKTSELEDGTITVGNSKKLNGLTKDELFADTNNKIKEINNNLAQLIKTTTVNVSADISANSSVFMNVLPPETPSGYRRLFAFIQGGSGSIDTSQLLIGSGTTGCRVYNNLPQKQTVTIECQIVYIKNC